ncbi:MAG: VapE domain-containing protein, partial [bacterium]
PRVQAIRDLLAANFTLIPLRGKIPLDASWQNTKRGAYTEANLPGNYGVAVGADIVVVDVDPRSFTPGDNPVPRLIQAVGPLDSFTVQTGGGGLHIYLRMPAGTLVKNTLKEYPGIEFKALGRQLVGPGSIHPESGKMYVVASGSPSKLAEAPSRLLALISRTAVPFDEVGTGTYMNDAATQGRYADYLAHTAPPSVQGKGGDHNALKVAMIGRDMGLPPATCWDLMVDLWNPRCSPPWDAAELKAKVINAYKFATGAVGTSHPQADFKDAPIPKGEELSWVTGKGGSFVKCFQNLLTFLRYPKAGMFGVFGYNEFTGRIEFRKPAPWHRGRMPRMMGVSDTDLKLLKGHLAMKHGFEMPVANIEEAVTNIAADNHFHPVRAYLNSLKWDGKPRLDSWLTDYMGVEESDFTRACARKTLCAAVQRVFTPGCKFDSVLVFEGLQGIGKSTVCKILGGPWTADFPLDPHNKDTVQQMQGKWFVELAELEVTRRADMQALKSFISRDKDEARLAYGRTVSEFPRQSILIGSINPGADRSYLLDDENRRWWPVKCDPAGGLVNFEALKAARDQIFAEAVQVVEAEKLYMHTEELKQAAKVQTDERHAEHAWTERIGGWLRDKQKAGVLDFLTSREVFLDAMGGRDVDFERREQLNIASALRDLGWERGHKRIEGVFTKGFVPKPTTKAAASR